MAVSKPMIISQARELFRTHGYVGASMRELAEMVGIKKASLYSHFATKEALVAEVLQLTLSEVFASDEPPASDWRERFQQVITRMAQDLSQHKRCVALHLAYGIPSEMPEAQQAVKAYFGACVAGLTEILSVAFPAATAQQIAQDALAQIEGATLWLALMDDAGSINRAIEQIMQRCDAMATSR